MDALKLYNFETIQTKKIYTLPSKKQKIIEQPKKEELKLKYSCYKCNQEVSLGSSERISCPSCQSRIVYKKPSTGLVYKSI